MFIECLYILCARNLLDHVTKSDGLDIWNSTIERSDSVMTVLGLSTVLGLLMCAFISFPSVSDWHEWGQLTESIPWSNAELFTDSDIIQSPILVYRYTCVLPVAVCRFSMSPSVLPLFFHEGLIRSYLNQCCWNTVAQSPNATHKSNLLPNVLPWMVRPSAWRPMNSVCFAENISK